MRRILSLSSLVALAIVVGCMGDDPPTIAPTPTSDAGPSPGPTPPATTPPPGDAGGDADTGLFDANVYGNLELWLRADVGVVTADGGANIVSWEDSSPAKRAVTVPASSGTCQNGPTVKPNVYGNLPGIHFDGGTQCMTVSGAFKEFSEGLTFFAVFLPENCESAFLGNSSALFDSYDNGSSSYEKVLSIGRNPSLADTATGDALLTSNGTVAITGGRSWQPGKHELLTFVLPNAPGGTPVQGTAFVDGVAAELGANEPQIPDFDPARTTTHIGYSQASAVNGKYGLYCGTIGEMILFSKALAAKDRITIETHLKARWSL